MDKRVVLEAASYIDWGQVHLNTDKCVERVDLSLNPSPGYQGVCFAIGDAGTFCLRGIGWTGHLSTSKNGHAFTSLHELLLSVMLS